MLHRPVLHHQHGLADLRLPIGETIREVTVDHAADDAVLLDRLGLAVDRIDRAAVAQHGDAVGDLGDLVELVRDQDRGDALRAERDQAIEQRGAVGLIQARGRLVEDEQPHLLGQRLRDLDQLLLADAEIGDQRVRRLAQADLRQQLPRAPVDLLAVDHACPRRRMREKDVFRDRHQRDQRQLLVDDDDPEPLAVVDVAEAALLAVEDDGPLVLARGIDPAQHLHQGRFAGTVLADESVDLAGFHREIDVTQRAHAGKALADAAHLQHCRHFGGPAERQAREGACRKWFAQSNCDSS